MTKIKNYLSKEFPEFKKLKILDPVEKDVEKLLTPIQHRSPDEVYNPLSVEILIDRAIMHLRNAIEKKSLAHELGEKAINSLLEYDLFKKMDDLENKRRSLEEKFKIGSKILSKQIEISKKIIKKDDHTNEVIISATDDSSKTIAEYEKKMFELSKENQELIKKYRELIADKNKISGNALNYEERYKEIKKIFEIELKHSYSLLKAAEEGLKTIYEIDQPLPLISSENYAEKLYTWVSEVLLKLEDLLQLDQEFTMTFSLKNGVWSGEQQEKFYIDSTSFQNEINTGIYKFNISKNVFLGLNNIRLRGVGVKVLTSEENSFDSWDIKINLPKQKMSNGNSLEMKEILFNAPTLGTTSNLKLGNGIKGISLYNSSPIGEWEIILPKKSTLGKNGYQEADDKPSVVQDLILEVYLASISK